MPTLSFGQTHQTLLLVEYLLNDSSLKERWWNGHSDSFHGNSIL